LNNIVENFSGILKNAALCTKFKPQNNWGKQKKKRKNLTNRGMTVIEIVVPFLWSNYYNLVYYFLSNYHKFSKILLVFFRNFQHIIKQKVSCTLYYNLYVDIFNLILRSGIYPSLWRENFIKPLFKGRCVSDPSCYRGIAISSCLSKFFTKILHNRLENYLEQNDIICPEPPILVWNVSVSPSCNLTGNETFLYIFSKILKKLPLMLYLNNL
jgi:hypothetical protein